MDSRGKLDKPMGKSIRRRLRLTFLGVAVGPLILAGTLLAWQTFRVQKTQALELQQQVARRVADKISSNFAAIADELTSIEAIRRVQSPNVDGWRRLLEAVQASQRAFGELAYLDDRGREEVRVSRETVLTDEDLRDRSEALEFEVPRRTGRVYFSPVAFDPVTGKPFLNVSHPVKDLREGSVSGVVVARIWLTPLWNDVVHERLEPATILYVLGPDGLVVAHPDPSVVLRGTRFVAPGVDGFTAGLSGRTAALAVHRVTVGTYELTVVAEQPLRTALDLPFRVTAIVLSLLLLVLTLSSLFARLAVRQIVRPVEDLADVARAIQAGDETRRAETSGNDEIADLAQAFNQMTGQLQGTLKRLEVEIAEHREADAARRQSQALLETVVSSAPLVLWAIDREGTFTLSRGRGLESLGLEPGQVVGQSVFHIYERNEAILRDTRRALAGESLTAEWEVGDVCFDVRYSPYIDLKGRIVGSIGVALDITQRKRAEEIVRESEARLRMIFEAAEDWIFIKNRDLEYTHANQSMTRILAPETGGLIGRKAADFLPPDEASKIARDEARVLEGETIREERELTVGGARRAFHTVEVPLRDQSGRIVGLCGIARDLTERKRLEWELAHAQKMQAVGTLAGGIAHDFNNLLQAIQGYAELLLLEGDPLKPSYSWIQQLTRASERGRELTGQLLAFSRKGKTPRQILNANDAVTTAAQLLERTIPKMIEVRLELADDVLPISTEVGQVERVLINLGVNARDAMPDGGTLVLSTVNEIPPQEFYRTHPEILPGRYVRISVRDTGHGIDEETVKRVFEPFFTTKSPGQGTGLGLAVAYGIVEEHGGHILVESTPGKGTTFSVLLPAASAPLTTEGTAEFPPGNRGSETILVVDDEADNRVISEAALARYGYQVITAATGEEALEIYRMRPDEIDLVVLDLVMPGMGGWRCLELLLQMAPAARVLIASGYSEKPADELVQKGGARGFVQKPYRLSEFLQVVRQVLDDGGPMLQASVEP